MRQMKNLYITNISLHLYSIYYDYCNNKLRPTQRTDSGSKANCT